jgi:hypothetical protein
MPSSKVVVLRSGSLPGPGLASVPSSGRLLSGTRSEVWLCQAYDANAQGLVLYVKPKLALRAVFVECLAALVGQCIGLPCPDPYLVTVKPQFVGRPPGKQLLAFGSVQAGGRGIAQPIRSVDDMIETLEQLGLSHAACVFDEWIANPVRGPGDVLFDAELGAVFVDHEGAMEASTAVDTSVTNWIASHVIARTPPGKRLQLLKAIRARAVAAHNVQFGQPPSVVQLDQDGAATYQALLQFLKERLAQLDKLLSCRILPDQAYLSPASDDDASNRTSNI